MSWLLPAAGSGCDATAMEFDLYRPDVLAGRAKAVALGYQVFR